MTVFLLLQSFLNNMALNCTGPLICGYFSVSVLEDTLEICNNLNVYFYLFLRESKRERGRGRERGRQRIPSRPCAVGTEPIVGLELINHESMTRVEMKSQMLNRLSNSGAPGDLHQFEKARRQTV